MAERELPGWGHVLHLAATRVDHAKAQVVTMGKNFSGARDDILFDVDVQDEEVEQGTKTTVSFDLTPLELVTAPEAIRRVFADLGIDVRKDGVQLQFAVVHSEGEFDVTVLPKEVTVDKMGVTLSTRAGEGAVIMHDPENTGSTISVPLYPEKIDLAVWSRESSRRGHSVRTLYGRLAGNKEDVLSSLNPHPYKVDILEAAAMWTPELLQNRPNPKFSS